MKGRMHYPKELEYKVLSPEKRMERMAEAYEQRFERLEEAKEKAIKEEVI